MHRQAVHFNRLFMWTRLVACQAVAGYLHRLLFTKIINRFTEAYVQTLISHRRPAYNPSSLVNAFFPPTISLNMDGLSLVLDRRGGKSRRSIRLARWSWLKLSLKRLHPNAAVLMKHHFAAGVQKADLTGSETTVLRDTLAVHWLSDGWLRRSGWRRQMRVVMAPTDSLWSKPERKHKINPSGNYTLISGPVRKKERKIYNQLYSSHTLFGERPSEVMIINFNRGSWRFCCITLCLAWIVVCFVRSACKISLSKVNEWKGQSSVRQTQDRQGFNRLLSFATFDSRPPLRALPSKAINHHLTSLTAEAAYEVWSFEVLSGKGHCTYLKRNAWLGWGSCLQSPLTRSPQSHRPSCSFPETVHLDCDVLCIPDHLRLRSKPLVVSDKHELDHNFYGCHHPKLI